MEEKTPLVKKDSKAETRGHFGVPIDKLAVVILFITYFVDMILITSVEPVLPEILLSIGAFKPNTPERENVFINATNTTTSVYLSDEELLGEVSATALGVLIGAKPIAQVIVNPFTGSLVDRIGTAAAGCMGFSSAFISTIGFAYGKSFLLLLFFRCIQGVGSSLLIVSSLSLVSVVFEDENERATAMGVGIGGVPIGILIGFPLGSVLYQFVGREMPFWVIAAIIAIAAVLRFGFVPWSFSRSSNAESKKLDKFAEIGIWMDPYILIASGIFFWECVGVACVTGLSPLFLLDSVGAEQWQIGTIFLIGGISQMIFQYFTSSSLSWSIPRWFLSMLGLFLIGIGLGIYPAITSVWLTLIPIVIYTAGLGFVTAAVPKILSDLADKRTDFQFGTVFAMADTGTNLGYFLGSIIDGILVEQYGFFWPFVGTSIIIFLYGLTCLSLRKFPAKEVG